MLKQKNNGNTRKIQYKNKNTLFFRSNALFYTKWSKYHKKHLNAIQAKRTRKYKVYTTRTKKRNKETKKKIEKKILIGDRLFFAYLHGGEGYTSHYFFCG